MKKTKVKWSGSDCGVSGEKMVGKGVVKKNIKFSKSYFFKIKKILPNDFFIFLNSGF